MKKFNSLIMYLLLHICKTKDKPKIYTYFLNINFGKNVRILHFPRFGSEPYLIEIGDNVTITRGVSFVNHDGGAALFRRERPGLNAFGKIKIGNNVFIGINSIILPGVTIGDNVVIGAGSLVNKSIPSNSVFAGVPAKYIKSIEEYKISLFGKSIVVPAKMNLKERKKFIIESLEK